MSSSTLEHLGHAGRAPASLLRQRLQAIQQHSHQVDRPVIQKSSEFIGKARAADPKPDETLETTQHSSFLEKDSSPKRISRASTLKHRLQVFKEQEEPSHSVSSACVLQARLDHLLIQNDENASVRRRAVSLQTRLQAFKGREDPLSSSSSSGDGSGASWSDVEQSHSKIESPLHHPIGAKHHVVSGTRKADSLRLQLQALKQ